MAAFQENTAATDALMRQIAIMQDAIGVLQNSIDKLTGSTDPENATWRDVSRFAHVSDAARRFVETIVESELPGAG